MTAEFHHIPVMLQPCLDGLALRPGGLYIDGTLGGCGHAIRILQAGGRLIGIDRDSTAIEVARQRLADYPVTLVHQNYNQISAILEFLGAPKVDGALLDLGVSSHQLDTPQRGFSYRFDAPLDMRMDGSAALTAWHVVNEYEPQELERILYRYGEEPYSKAIVRRIMERRAQQPIETTFELVELIKSAMPPKVRWEGKHPAKRTFQAIRIAVNDELSKLEQTMFDFCNGLASGGRLCVITFHSLEDRIVKNAFQQLAKGCECPADFPICVCGKQPVAKLITRKPILPSARELEENPRSASAKLRIIEKL